MVLIVTAAAQGTSRRRGPAGDGPSWTKGEKLKEVEAVAWSQSIAGVSLETAAAYCAGVRRWAGAVLADTEELLRRLD